MIWGMSQELIVNCFDAIGVKGLLREARDMTRYQHG